MRVALYQPWIYLRGGIERWMHELVVRSRHDWIVYTHHHEPTTTFAELGDLEIVELVPRVSVNRSLAPLARAAMTVARTRLPADGAQAVVVSSEGFGDLIAVRERRPIAVYCHTPLKILHDPVARQTLKEKSPKQALALGVLGGAYHAVDRRMWRRFEHVFVNSEETGRRVGSAGLSHTPEVLRPGVDLESWATPSGAPRSRTLLVAGRVMWQKHVDLAIETLRVLRARGDHDDVDLVIAGAVDAKSLGYVAHLKSLAAGLPVTFVENPSDERLRALYSSSMLLLFTPPNEDWGIVPLEAMAAGLPVLAIDAGGPKESIAHEAGGWLLPDDPQAWADQIAATSGSLEQQRVAARERASIFGWDAHVARMDAALDEMVERRRKH